MIKRLYEPSCRRCGKLLNKAERESNQGKFCKECLEWLDSEIYEYNFRTMQEENPKAREGDFIEMLFDYVDVKDTQHSERLKSSWTNAEEEIRRRLKEEQNLCQR